MTKWKIKTEAMKKGKGLVMVDDKTKIRSKNKIQ